MVVPRVCNLVIMRIITGYGPKTFLPITFLITIENFEEIAGEISIII